MNKKLHLALLLIILTLFTACSNTNQNYTNSNHKNTNDNYKENIEQLYTGDFDLESALNENVFRKFTSNEIKAMNESSVIKLCGAFSNGFCIKKINIKGLDNNGRFLSLNTKSKEFGNIAVWNEDNYKKKLTSDNKLGFTDYELGCKEIFERSFKCSYTDPSSETIVRDLRLADDEQRLYGKTPKYIRLQEDAKNMKALI